MNVDISTINYKYTKSVHVFGYVYDFCNTQRKIIKFWLTNTGPTIVTEVTEIQ